MNINLTAPINDLGYGVVGRNLLKNLSEMGVKVCYWPIGQPSVDNQEIRDLIKECMIKRDEFKHYSPSLRIWHQNDMAQHIGSGKRIGFPIFELNKFTKVEKNHLASLDNIIVCSQWAKTIIEQEVPLMKYRIGIAPLGVDKEIFYPRYKNQSEKTVFLNVGKWEIRKGHDILIESFNKAFEKDDMVELWMMNHNPFLPEQQEKEWLNLYLDSKLGSKIKIIPRAKTHKEVAEIMSQSDVGVFPSRAEGWNLEALEMMAMGKDVILTGYSAHTEFANEKNADIIKIEKTEDAHDGIWFHGQGEWAKIGTHQIEQLVDYMRKAYRNRMGFEEHQNEEGIKTAGKFSWKNCSKNVMEFCGYMRGF